MLARSKGFILLSEDVYEEITGVLRRPKLARLLPDDRSSEILALLSEFAIWTEPSTKVQDCRDAKDNMYLELALAAGADAIVSGDEDLLVLHPWRGVSVLRPAAFLDQFSL